MSNSISEKATHPTVHNHRFEQTPPSLDLDTDEDVRSLVTHVVDPATKNFLIAFDSRQATALLDADCTTLADALDEHSPDLLSTQWLAVLKPAESRDLLEHLAKRYDFVPRLLADMQSSPRQTAAAPLLGQAPAKARFHPGGSRTASSSPSSTAISSAPSMARGSTLQQITYPADCSIYDLAAEIWHYTTLDFGRRYICCGYNAIHDCANIVEEGRSNSRLASCVRVWTWIIICDDGTIITVTEDVLQQLQCTSARVAEQILAKTRGSMIDVLRSLSFAQHAQAGANHGFHLSIRSTISPTLEEALRQDREAPGLLFFYLFEFWRSTYSLITRKESRYGIELERLRHEMLERPRLDHIDRLHRIGQELGNLERHYISYNSLIARLLEPRPVTAASLQNSRVVDAVLNEDEEQSERLPVPARESSLGVSLSTTTRIRFQRLRDQIELYALSEIDEYLAQKDSLVSLNFNLLTLRESLDVERLTRITLLLTKATILFLPVSFMTSYFGLQLTDAEYTIPQFWVSFAVILTVSWLGLYTFGILSGTAQTSIVLSTVGRAVTRLISCRTGTAGSKEAV